MRIHWAIVVFAVIGTVLLTWHFRTKDMDFLTPNGLNPPQDRQEGEIAVAQAAVQPEIKEASVPGQLIPGETKEPVRPEIPKITESDLGDLEAGPGLGEYRTFAQSNSPEHLFELSSTLRARGHFQRALLALERIIDSSEASAEILQEAGQGIAALTPTLPRWNVDSGAEIPLELHLSLARPASEPLERAVSELALLIRQSSGDQLNITPKIDTADHTEAPADSPVALWLSSTGENPVSSSVLTARLSSEPGSLLPDLALALFQTIRSYLERSGYPKGTPLDQSGSQLLETQITRLMWHDFARALVPATETKVGDSDTEVSEDPASEETN